MGRRRRRRDQALLVEAKETARKTKEELDRVRERRAEVEEEIRLQRKVREENGFGQILEAIFTTGK